MVSGGYTAITLGSLLLLSSLFVLGTTCRQRKLTQHNILYNRGHSRPTSLFHLPKPCPPLNFQWSGKRGLNPQRPAWKAGTLPIELFPHGCGRQIRTEPPGYEPGMLPLHYPAIYKVLALGF